MTGLGVPFHDRRADHCAAALDGCHDIPAQDRNPGRRNLPGKHAAIGRARVDHRVDLDAGGEMVKGGAIAIVVIGEHHGAPARRHGEAIDIGAHGAGQHHPRPVVAGEHQRPLNRAGGDQNAARLYFPIALARRERRRLRQMIGDPFDRADPLVVKHPKGGGASQHGDIFAGHQICRRRRRPIRRRPAVNGQPLAPQTAAHLVLLIQ